MEDCDPSGCFCVRVWLPWTSRRATSRNPLAPTTFGEFGQACLLDVLPYFRNLPQCKLFLTVPNLAGLSWQVQLQVILRLEDLLQCSLTRASVVGLRQAFKFKQQTDGATGLLCFRQWSFVKQKDPPKWACWFAFEERTPTVKAPKSKFPSHSVAMARVEFALRPKGNENGPAEGELGRGGLLAPSTAGAAGESRVRRLE